MAKDRSRKTRVVMWLHRLLRWIAGPFFKWWYRMSSENQEIADNLRPPYILVPNHVMTFDPAIVNYFIPVPVHNVASDANFRKPLNSFLLRLLGTIATSKLADDLASLRLMLNTLKEGKVIGIFAEGQRSWDGRTLSIIPSTAKLVKIAKVPVLVSLIKGGYMSSPRWSFGGRRGRVVVEHKLAVTAEEARTLSADEITRKIEAAMAHDDSEYQDEKRVAYTSKTRAEKLQLALFYCPSCSSLNTMKSSGHDFYCEHCGYSLVLTGFYRFRLMPRRVANPNAPARAAAHTDDGPAPFRTIGEWSDRQTAVVTSMLEDLYRSGEARELFSDDEAVLFTGYRLAPLKEQGPGRLSLSMDGLRFAHDDPPMGERFFPWPEVKALNIVYQDQLEFYFGKTLFVVKFPNHDTSAYKYELCSRILDRLRAASE